MVGFALGGVDTDADVYAVAAGLAWLLGLAVTMLLFLGAGKRGAIAPEAAAI